MDVATATVAVIPCLNEAAAIADVVSAARSCLGAVIVVDDGSRDETGKAAAGAGAEVLRHEQPRGKGAALETGWRRALERGFEWALTLDGDGQHAPEDIPTFLEEAHRGGCRLIVGNRMARPVGMPWLRRQVNRWMSRRLSKAAGQRLPDTQCGYRLMHLPTWSRLELKTRNYEIESEVLLAFAEAGERISFVPIQVIYRDEESKIHPFRDTVRWFRWLWNRK